MNLAKSSAWKPSMLMRRTRPTEKEEGLFCPVTYIGTVTATYNRPAINGQNFQIFISSLFFRSHSPDHLQCKLNLPCRRGCGRQHTCRPRDRPVGIKDISIRWGRGRSEVRPIEKVKNFCPELNVEALGEPSNTVVLEQREIKVGETRPGQYVA